MTKKKIEVKKGIGRDECLMEIVNTVSSIAESYYGVNKICPVEITFSQNTLCYVNDYDDEVYISRVNDKGVMQAVYYGSDPTKDGNIYIQHFRDIFLPCISKIQDDVEFEDAKKMLQIDVIDKKYLWEARNILKLAVPEADLFLWTNNPTTLHITDLNQDHTFKRELMKKGLI